MIYGTINRYHDQKGYICIFICSVVSHYKYIFIIHSPAHVFVSLLEFAIIDVCFAKQVHPELIEVSWVPI